MAFACTFQMLPEGPTQTGGGAERTAGPSVPLTARLRWMRHSPNASYRSMAYCAPGEL